MELKKILLTAINTSIEGGKAIMDIYNTDFSIEHKEDNSPLTLADKTCNDIIEKKLLNTGIPVLSEEGKHTVYNERKKWEYLWLVDPLDGTKEFVKKNGEFTVNIALIHKGNPILGVIFVPVTQELYFGIEMIGSYKCNCENGLIDNLDVLINQSRKLPLQNKRDNYIIVGSRSHMSIETEKYYLAIKEKYDKVEILSKGSSLKLCMVAEGKADVYPRYAPTMEWDTAAGHAIVNYAGFSVKQYNSEKDVIYNKENLLNPWFIAK
mgnify:CR=1 FL=1|tara:strand:- start:897 stop:1691 length:795 start_codon:yes stop_codon:yes gene_type:complete